MEHDDFICVCHNVQYKCSVIISFMQQYGMFVQNDNEENLIFIRLGKKGSELLQ